MPITGSERSGIPNLQLLAEHRCPTAPGTGGTGCGAHLARGWVARRQGLSQLQNESSKIQWIILVLKPMVTWGTPILGTPSKNCRRSNIGNPMESLVPFFGLSHCTTRLGSPFRKQCTLVHPWPSSSSSTWASGAYSSRGWAAPNPPSLLEKLQVMLCLLHLL